MALAKHAEEIQEKIWENEARLEEKWSFPAAARRLFGEQEQEPTKGGERE